MKKAILFVIFSILILGGCGMKNQDVTKKESADQSDAAALQDEFTREFIDSTVKVEEGYLQFKSKSGGYTMLYPKDAIAYPTSYETNGDRFEALKFGGETKSEMPFYAFTTYEWSKDVKDAESYLYLLSTSNKYEGDYERLDTEEANIYYATKEFGSDTDKNSETLGVIGFVQSKKSNQAVSYEYYLVCRDEQKSCSTNEEEVRDEVLKLMESITFIPPND